MSAPTLRHVRVTITGWTCTDSPGFLAFTLTDADGVLHHFEDKAPVLLTDLPAQFPLAASVLCQVLQHSCHNGQCTIEVDTSPWGIASDQDVHRFWVHASQMLDDAPS